MDERIALGKNEKIADVYTVISEIGRGGSSIVYEAFYIDNCKLKHRVRIKEYYPYLINIIRDRNSIVCINENAKKIFEKNKKIFMEGYQKNVEFQYDDYFVNTSLDARDVIESNGTVYIIYSIDGGTTLDKYMPSTLNECIKITIAISLAVKKYHQRGYLHLDIKPENILVYDDTKDIVVLFDYDSVTKYSSIKNDFSKISYSKGFSAPELVRGDVSKIGYGTDIFSIGAILYNLLWKKTPNYADMDYGASFNFDDCRYIDEKTRTELFTPLTDIFHNTLSSLVNKRYKNIDVLIDNLDIVSDYADPTSFYIVNTIPSERYFIGREEELSTIGKLFKESNIVVLSGIGGIGKSIIAEQYALRNINKYNSFARITFEESLIEMICDDIRLPIANFNLRNDEDIFAYAKRKIKMLQELCDEHTLLLIDNLDSIEFGEDKWIWNELLSLKAKVIVTSRITEWSYPILEIKEINNNKDKLSLFYNYCKTKDDEYAIKIIEMVQGHTALIELIAKQIEASFSTPKEKYNEMIKSGVVGTDSNKVLFNKNNKITNEIVLQHIKYIFNTSKLSKKQKVVLHNLCYFSNVRIDAKEFIESINLTNYDEINDLIRMGWIQRDNKELYTHPIISDVIKLEKDDVILDSTNLIQKYTQLLNEKIAKSNGCIRFRYKVLCGEIFRYLLNNDVTNDITIAFIKAYSTRYELFCSRDTLEKSYSYIIDAECRKNKEEPSETTIIYLQKMAELYRDNDEYDKSLLTFEKVLSSLKKKYDEKNGMGAVYNGLGILNKKMGDYSKSEEWFLKALDYLSNKENNKQNMGRRAIIYSNLGNLYKLYIPEKAEYYLQEALHIVKDIDGYHEKKYTYRMCGCMINLGEYYITVSRLEDAWDLLNEAKRICDLMYEGKGKLAISILNAMKLYYLATGDLVMFSEIKKSIEKLQNEIV